MTPPSPSGVVHVVTVREVAVTASEPDDARVICPDLIPRPDRRATLAGQHALADQVSRLPDEPAPMDRGRVLVPAEFAGSQCEGADRARGREASSGDRSQPRDAVEPIVADALAGEGGDGVGEVHSVPVRLVCFAH